MGIARRRSIMSKQPLTERLQSGQADANGIARPDPADEKEFQALADQWWRETAHFSYLPRKYQHVAYRKILAMSTRAVPLILRRLKEEGGWWFEALAAITMENPARDVAGYEGGKDAWLRWGRERGFID